MSENRRRTPRLLGLVISTIMVPLLLVVPASLPLCDMAAGAACAVEAPVVPAGSHCPMEAAGLDTMPCCVEDAAPQGPAPAAPGKADADLRVQVKAQGPASAVVSASWVAPAAALSAPVSAADPAASAVPLYTLLSTLLN